MTNNDFHRNWFSRVRSTLVINNRPLTDGRLSDNRNSDGLAGCLAQMQSSVSAEARPQADRIWEVMAFMFDPVE